MELRQLLFRSCRFQLDRFSLGWPYVRGLSTSSVNFAKAERHPEPLAIFFLCRLRLQVANCKFCKLANCWVCCRMTSLQQTGLVQLLMNQMMMPLAARVMTRYCAPHRACTYSSCRPKKLLSHANILPRSAGVNGKLGFVLACAMCGSSCFTTV